MFAGDVARFVDLGFSPDGRTYFFGQYGKFDQTFIPYAEIYAVDVQKNDFTKVFKSSGFSRMQDGLSAFEELKAKHNPYLFGSGAVPPKQVIYLRESLSSPTEVEFQDFERSTMVNPLIYTVKLTPHVEGWGDSLKSSFYITVERRKPEGVLVDRTVIGNPDIKRAGVTAYSIEKIFLDAAGKSLVIVVEKTLQDKDAISVRYMVETALLK